MAEVARGHDLPILVFAGTVRQARDWIVEKGISPAWCHIITPLTLEHWRGAFGNPHVIVTGQLSHDEIEQIREFVIATMSPPLEDVDDLRLRVSGGPGPADLG